MNLAEVMGKIVPDKLKEMEKDFVKLKNVNFYKKCAYCDAPLLLINIKKETGIKIMVCAKCGWCHIKKEGENKKMNTLYYNGVNYVGK